MRWCSQSAVFLIALLAAVGVAHAQEGTPSLQGTYTLDAAASDDVNAAIERAIARMNMVKRPIARGRLKKTTQPYQQMVIEQTSSEVTTTMNNLKPISTPVNGTPIQWTREDGETFDVSTQWDNGKLKQTFKAEDGQRVNAFSLSPDGSMLTMDVTVTSSKLSRPLLYKLVFRKT
ncbi:MAG TPA: hypothetical protein VF815_23405 [Myxococcaceae bacterium]|jgi:hypothetical protein